MTEEFKVGDKVIYVPDPKDPTAYLVADTRARVVGVLDPEEAGSSHIAIRFQYNPKVWPVRPDELQKMEDTHG